MTSQSWRTGPPRAVPKGTKFPFLDHRTLAEARPMWTKRKARMPELRQPKVLLATGWAMLDYRGKILVNSIRDTPSAARLAAGEGHVYPVTIFLEMEPKENNGDDQTQQ